MTITTISTVGFSEVRPFSRAGRDLLLEDIQIKDGVPLVGPDAARDADQPSHPDWATDEASPGG